MNTKRPKTHSDNSYDAIIIGGGVAGLSAAAILTKAGRKTLLVEKESRLGGLSVPLVHGQYEFDVGPRVIMGGNADGPFGPGVIHSFLEMIGARKDVEFIQLQPIANVHFPETKFQVWSGREQYMDGIREAAPLGLEKLPELFDLCERLFRKSINYSRDGKPWTVLRALVEMPEFIRYNNTKASTILSRYIPDRRTRTVIGALWPYIGIAPARASFLAWADMMATYIEEGAYFFRGGVHQLAEAIGRAVTRAGGEIRLGNAVKRVLVRDRKVVGVEMADGECFYAPAVIATVDPRMVFGDMMDPAESPIGFRRRLARLTPADTGITIAFVTDLDLPARGFAFENLFFDSWDEDQAKRHPANGQVGFFTLTVTTAADPGLAPPGQHLVSVFAGLPFDAPMGTEHVQRYGEILMGAVLKHIPGLKGHLLLAGQGTEKRGYLTHAFGPIYGWEATPWQASLGRPDLITPVKGLILAGQWTRPIQGVMPVVLSGWEAARIVLRGNNQ